MSFMSTFFTDLQSEPTASEFQQLVASLNAFLAVSFNADGTLINPPSTQSVPLGGIIPFAGSATTDPNYLLCDGSAVSRVQYKDLFNLIGATYGGGDGSTTFNVPDLRQRFPLGKAIAGTGATLGATGGVIDHTHSVPGLSVPSLTASVTGTTDTQGAHSHGGSTGSTDVGHTHTFSGTTGNNIGGADQQGTAASVVAPAPHQHGFSGTTDLTSLPHSHSISIDGSHSHNVTASGTTGTGTTGTGTSGTNNPPFLVLNYLVRAKI